ncbi:MAG: hypothetical protein WB421_13785, partial [Terriglobales bacterium]
YLIYNNASKFDRIVVITSTKSNGFYNFITKQDDVHEVYSEDIIEDLVESAKRILNKGKKPPRVLVIAEDLIGLKGLNLKYSDAFNRLYSSGRHFGISCIVSIQYVNCISPIIRCNSNYVLITNVLNTKQLEVLYASFGFGNLKEFGEMIDKVCHDYQILMIDVSGYNRYIFMDKADIVPKGFIFNTSKKIE